MVVNIIYIYLIIKNIPIAQMMCLNASFGLFLGFGGRWWWQVVTVGGGWWCDGWAIMFVLVANKDLW